MRFNFEAYEKVYPETAPAVSVESAVDTFKPTESEAKATEDKPGDDVMASVPVKDEPETTPVVSTDIDPSEGGTNG